LQVSDPDDLAALLADITEDIAELDAGEISVVSELLVDLATEAVNNTQVGCTMVYIFRSHTIMKCSEAKWSNPQMLNLPPQA